MKNQKGNISVIISFIVLIIFTGLVVYILINNKEEVNINEEQTIGNAQIEETPDTSQNNMETNKRTLKDFTPVSKTTILEKIDLVVGNGNEVKAGDTVSVHYTGAVASTGEIFQSSKDFGTEPITFPLSGVIKGWTDGIPGMKVGGTRRLVIPADMAYGANPPGGSGIPANADLVFDVELVGIK